tara:strand:- start:3049 stop:3657 length:609 start_codon:yes stop_codon:yes gene_type:complete
MSEFSRSIGDYISFDEYDIIDRYGDSALSAVMDDAQNQLDELVSMFESAESDSEREFVIEQIGDFDYDEYDAISIAEDYEFDYLAGEMSLRYKSMDIIERYLELIGGGYSAGGGGGGGGSPTPRPQPPQLPEPEEEEEEFILDLFDIFDLDDLITVEVDEEGEESYDSEEYDDYMKDIEYSFWDLDLESTADSIGKFFEDFF